MFVTVGVCLKRPQVVFGAFSGRTAFGNKSVYSFFTLWVNVFYDSGPAIWVKHSVADNQIAVFLPSDLQKVSSVRRACEHVILPHGAPAISQANFETDV